MDFLLTIPNCLWTVRYSEPSNGYLSACSWPAKPFTPCNCWAAQRPTSHHRSGGFLKFWVALAFSTWYAQPNRCSQTIPDLHLSATAGRREGEKWPCIPKLQIWETQFWRKASRKRSAPICTVGNGAKRLPQDMTLFYLALNDYANASRKRSEKS